jgi:hypothetical protein
MQNAQNTFYITLRNRLAALNPSRTLYLRGITRPGILVEGNEIVTGRSPSNVFILRWRGLQTNFDLPEAVLQMNCEIEYAVEGTTANIDMDRGTMLTEMDMELIALLKPANVQKMNYTQSTATAMGTRVFWTEPKFQPVSIERDRLQRTATISVFSYEEPGEE